jgi:hypothetical protein
MDDEPESSRAGLLRPRDGSSSDVNREQEQEHAVIDVEEDSDGAEDAAEREKIAKERRFDAKRKRILFLENLLRELDTLVFLEFITIYHLEYVCLLVRAIHGSILSWPQLFVLLVSCPHRHPCQPPDTPTRHSPRPPAR